MVIQGYAASGSLTAKGGGGAAMPKDSGQRLDSMDPEIFDSIHMSTFTYKSNRL